jgi:hypothetical protein
MREFSAHAQNANRSVAAEIFAIGTYFPNTPRILHIRYPSIVYGYDWAVNIAAKCYCLGLYLELFGQAVAIIHDLHDIHTFLYPYPIGHTFLRLHKYTVCWICLLHAAVMKGSKTPFTTSNTTMT